jgi:hypothetical protein
VPAAEEAFVARPRKLRVLAAATAIALCVLTAVGWFALPAEVRVLFSVSQRLTLVAVLAVLLLVIVAVAASYVRADAEGVRFRNGLRSHQGPGDRVHKIILRPGDPWAMLLLTPADGREFRVDLDAEKRQLMGIQAGDHALADQAVRELRRRLTRYRGT